MARRSGDDGADDDDVVDEAMRERDELIRMIIEEERATFASEREGHAREMAAMMAERDDWRARHDDVVEAMSRDALPDGTARTDTDTAPLIASEDAIAIAMADRTTSWTTTTTTMKEEERIRALMATNFELEATIDLLARDSDDWQSKYASSIERTSKLESDIVGLGGLLEYERTIAKNVVEERDELSTQVSDLRNDVVGLANELTRVGNERDSLRGDMDDAMAHHARERERLAMEVENLRREVRDVARAREAEVLELWAANGADKRALEDAEYLVTELKGKAAEREASHEAMIAEIVGIVCAERKGRVDGEALADGRAAMSKGRETLVDSVAALVVERDGLIVKVEELQRGGIECFSLMEDLHSQLASSTEELSNIARHLEYAEAGARALAKERDDLLADSRMKALGAAVRELSPEEYEILCLSTGTSKCVLDVSGLVVKAMEGTL